MQRSLKDLEGYVIHATDGEIGKVADFLLDDERWVVRYLVVDTGGFFGGRRVLISPIAVIGSEAVTRVLNVNLTMEKVKASPDFTEDAPVSRQREQEFNLYHGYADYWSAAGIWGGGMYPALMAGSMASEPLPDAPVGASGDAHLRSAAEVRGYHVHGSDDSIGHIEDFIADDETWSVRYLVVDTSNWWIGKKVLVAPRWAERIGWEERKVHFAMSRDAIKNSPEWDPSAAVNRDYEARLYDYYGRPVYWGEEGRPEDGGPSSGQLPPPAS